MYILIPNTLAMILINRFDIGYLKRAWNHSSTRVLWDACYHLKAFYNIKSVNRVKQNDINDAAN